VKKRRRRRPHYHPGVVAPVTHAPNDLWTADFKGHFRTRDGVYCYPLTIADQHTRFLLTCQGLLSTKGLGVRTCFVQAFRAHGLPHAIRTDNGVPFATNRHSRPLAAQRLVDAAWGIQHQRSRPRHPPGQRGPRAHAQNAEGRRHPPAPRLARGAAARLQCVPPRVQRRAAAPVLRGRSPSDRYRVSHAPIRAAAPARVPGALSREARDERRHPFASSTGCSLSPTPSSNINIGMEEIDDGIWSTLLESRSACRLNERDYIIRTDTLTPTQCYPCSRSTLLPMFPVAHARMQYSQEPQRRQDQDGRCDHQTGRCTCDNACTPAAMA